jgi:hypothetical protein
MSNGKKGKKVQNQRFQRVKAENVSFSHELLADNSFDARVRSGSEPCKTDITDVASMKCRPQRVPVSTITEHERRGI